MEGRSCRHKAARHSSPIDGIIAKYLLESPDSLLSAKRAANQQWVNLAHGLNDHGPLTDLVHGMAMGEGIGAPTTEFHSTRTRFIHCQRQFPPKYGSEQVALFRPYMTWCNLPGYMHFGSLNGELLPGRRAHWMGIASTRKQDHPWTSVGLLDLLHHLPKQDIPNTPDPPWQTGRAICTFIWIMPVHMGMLLWLWINLTRWELQQQNNWAIT